MKTIRIFIVILLVSCFLMGTATAEEDVEVELFTCITPNDVRTGHYEVRAETIVKGTEEEMYPVKIMYFLDNKEVFNNTFDKSINGLNSGFVNHKWFALSGEPNGVYRNIKVIVFNKNGTVIGSVSKYEPIYIVDQDTKAELQLVVIKISKIDDGILGWFKKDLYQTTFSVKNMNSSLAFKGTITIGGSGIRSWRETETLILGPRNIIEIEGPILKEEDLSSIRTELRYCTFC